MRIGFDNEKYLKIQSERIKERIDQFGDKLYLEFGGKLFDDNHASRVLPGFKPDSKLQMLMQLSDYAEILFVISALDIEKNKMRGDLGITYDEDVLRLRAEFEKVGRVFITTENGAVGEQGYVTQHSVLAKEQFGQVYTCGPKPMMVAVARWAKGAGVACEVSLENKMACGVGACLCCVEDTKEGNVCVCKEGPVFSIDKLSWQI